MDVKTKVDIESRKQRINNVLLLNSSFIDNLGLMHGKMGIAIYFYHLARESHNKIYEDYAGELIDEIYNEITFDTPLDFENGLSGIGWGIEYLVQNKFLKADTDEVLEEFDKRLQLSEDKFLGIGLLKGFTGLGTYYLKRMQNPNCSEKIVSKSRHILKNVIDKLKTELVEISVQDFINDSENFDLIWDYPILIIFLSEVQQCIKENKIFHLIELLLNPFEKDSIPGQHCKKLMLAVVINKLLKIDKQFGSNYLDEIQANFLSEINREILFKELTKNSSFMQNGTSGVAWLYRQLFFLTKRKDYLNEMKYWLDLGFSFPESDQGYAGFEIINEQEGKAFGLLRGLAGINFKS